MSYDIIGDIHGNADKLEALLARIGYSNPHAAGSPGAWRHPTRTAVFVGDFIDRGPHQRRTVELVRRMVESGSALAVMGNHEFNAIAWFLPDPDADGEHLRPHRGALGAKNRHQHQSFLAEYETDPPAHRDCIDWFLTLPLWLELPELRVVHACWHDGYMAELAPQLAPGHRLTADLVRRASRAGSMAFRTVEGLTKGLEASLPPGHEFRDKDGITRTQVRTRWWLRDARTYREAALLPPELAATLPDVPLVGHASATCPTGKPVFFGHYWLTGEPAPLGESVACVDYSAGKDGPLVAYRWDGETRLSARNFRRSH